MKKLLPIILLMVMLLATSTVVLASDITGATFYGIITAKNIGTVATDVSCNVSINTQALINAGFLNSSCNNSAVYDTSGIDTAFMPAVNASYPWCFNIPNIGENAYQNYLLYTGGPAMGGKIRYFPGTGGMTTVQSATLELSDNFTIKQRGWIDTVNGSSKYLTYKEGAFATFVSPTVSQNITADIIASPAFYPDKHVEATSVDGYVVAAIAETSWDGIHDNAGTAADDTSASTIYWGLTTTNVANKYDTMWRSYFLFDTSSIPDGAVIHSAYFQVYGTSKADAIGITPDINVYSAVPASNTALVAGDYVHTKFGTTAFCDTPIAYADWNVAGYNTFELNATGIVAISADNITKFGLRNASYDAADVDPTHAGGGGALTSSFSGFYADQAANYPRLVVCYGYPSVTATGVASGEHTVRVDGSGGTLLGIGVDVSDDNVGLPITDNLSLNAPFWHSELDGSPFTTKDGNEYTCTNTGATWSSSDGRVFDGNDYIDIGAVADFSFMQNTGIFTIEFWMKLTDYTQAGIQHPMDNVKGGTAGKGTSLYYNGANDNFTLIVAKGTAGNPVISSSSSNNIIADNDWHHIMITANATNVYYTIDTVKETGSDVMDAGFSAGDSSFTMIVGGYQDTPTGNLIGSIGEMRFYTSEFDVAQNLENYNATKWKYDGSTDYYYYQIGASVPTTTANWTFLENNVMPYMEYHKITIDGVLQQHIEWEYDTTFHDLSLHDHDATPTFRTTSSDADVSAELVSFSPIAEAKAPAWVLAEERAFFTDNITTTGEFTTTPSPTMPGTAIIEAIANASGTPAQLPFTVITGFVLVAISITTSWFLAKHGSRNLWIKVMIIAVLMAFFIALKMFDFWMLMFFLIMAIAVVLFSRQRAGA